jgi:hypothetical protein
MAILFGETREDGKIRVWRTLHEKAVGVPHKIEDNPDGYEFDKIPEYPTPLRGTDDIWLYDPKTKEHSFERVERPINEEEKKEIMLEKMDKLINLLEKEEVKK